MSKVIDKIRVQGNPAPVNFPTHTLSHSASPRLERNRNENRSRGATQAQEWRLKIAGRNLHSSEVSKEALMTMQVPSMDKSASVELALLKKYRKLSLEYSEADDNVAPPGQFAPEMEQGAPEMEQGAPEMEQGLLGKQQSDLGGKVQNQTENGRLFDTQGQSRNVTHSHRSRMVIRPPANSPATMSPNFLLAAPALTLSKSATHSAPAKLKHGGVPHLKTGHTHLAQRSGMELARSLKSGMRFELNGFKVVSPRSSTGQDSLVTSNVSQQRHVTSSKSQRSSRSAFRSRLLGLKDKRLYSFKDDRNSSRTEGPRTSTSSILRQCLQVSQSQAPPDFSIEQAANKSQVSSTGTGYPVMSSESEKAATKVSNPLVQLIALNGSPPPSKSKHRYIFDSLASYIHFNKVYKQGKVAPPDGSRRTRRFTAPLKHSSHTLLMRMVLDLNHLGHVQGVTLGHSSAGAPSFRSNNSSDVIELVPDNERARDVDGNLSPDCQQQPDPTSQTEDQSQAVSGSVPSGEGVNATSSGGDEPQKLDVVVTGGESCDDFTESATTPLPGAGKETVMKKLMVTLPSDGVSLRE